MRPQGEDLLNASLPCMAGPLLEPWTEQGATQGSVFTDFVGWKATNLIWANLCASQ